MSDQKTPKWLKDTQIRSWEPEILLSGIVLFGLFKIPEQLDNLLWYVKNNISGSGDWNNFVSMMKVAIYWLITGLFLHLIARGLWVGLVGLSYVFPDGVNKEKLNFKYGFKNTILKIPFPVDSIEKLERLCSSLFSISFMLFMSIVGAYIYLFITIILPVVLLFRVFEFETNNNVVFGIYILTILASGLLYMIDFLTSGLLKRIKYFSKVYYYIHRIISFLTLSPIYRPIYYSLVSNFNRWWISGFYIVFVVSTIWLSDQIGEFDKHDDNWSSIETYSDDLDYNMFSGYYENRNEKFASFQAQIPSDVIEEDYLRLFINLNVQYQERIKEHCLYDSLIETVDNLDSLKLTCVESFYHVWVDDSLISDPPMKFHYNQKSQQRGVVSYLDISWLDQNMHEVKITRAPNDRVVSQIPFFRVKK